jgi:hypothetical protein
MTGSRGWRSAAAAFVAACLIPAAAPVAHADRMITSPGPIESLWVGDDLACQVSYVQGSTYEFYPAEVAPGDCGAMVAVDGVLHTPDFEAHSSSATDFADDARLIPVTETLTGSGTAQDPFLITTNAAASDVAVQQRISYVTGQSSYRVEITLTNTSQVTGHDVITYYAGDCFASGSDIGFGFVRPEIRSIGCAQNPNNDPPARTIQMIPLRPGSAGVEDRFHAVWDRINTLSPFDNSCLCTESVDNGVALQWTTRLSATESATFALQVAFTESQPTAMADTDGDAIPDPWETGGAAVADAENLAALGADPNRKDIFVHADWMQGCQPTAGWERRAIQMFAERGIALHIDSGPASINANGQPWGALSRAGAVSYAANVDLRASWSQLDAFKDQYFAPSGRRRAFFYLLFAARSRMPTIRPR